jgi:hypothetical protein
VPLEEELPGVFSALLKVSVIVPEPRASTPDLAAAGRYYYYWYITWRWGVAAAVSLRLVRLVLFVVFVVFVFVFVFVFAATTTEDAGCFGNEFDIVQV